MDFINSLEDIFNNKHLLKSLDQHDKPQNELEVRLTIAFEGKKDDEITEKAKEALLVLRKLNVIHNPKIKFSTTAESGELSFSVLAKNIEYSENNEKAN